MSAPAIGPAQRRQQERRDARKGRRVRFQSGDAVLNVQRITLKDLRELTSATSRWAGDTPVSIENVRAQYPEPPTIINRAIYVRSQR